MNTVVRALEASVPVYRVSEHGYSTPVSLVDGRDFFVDAPFEGDVVTAPAVRTLEGVPALLEDLDAGFDVRQAVCSRTRRCELRVRDAEGGRDR